MANPNWIKGVSGNPRGRPKKGNTLNDRMEKFFKGREPDEDDGKKRKRIDLLIKDIWKAARKGDFQAQRYLMDRLGGRPTEKVELTGDEGDPIPIVFLPEKVSPDEWIKDGNRECMESAAKTTDSTKVSG